MGEAERPKVRARIVDSSCSYLKFSTIVPAFRGRHSSSVRMAITPAYYVDEEELMSLKSLVDGEGEVDEMYQDMDEAFRILLRKAAELETNEEAPSVETLDWAEDLEDAVVEAAAFLADQVEGIRRGVAALALRPGEEALVEELRRHAVLSEAQRADAVAVVAAMRRLRERCLRGLAAREHITDPLPPRFVGYVEDTIKYPSWPEGCGVPTPEALAAAAVAEDAAVQEEERMARLAGSLRRGAAEFAARPGEEALAAALERHAASADATRATVEAFTASVRRFQATGKPAP
ncbi:hypothetical protein ACP70R_020817 [Stipagrostis hirtigluma subsp. patula]